MKKDKSKAVENFYSGDSIFTNGAFVTPVKVKMDGVDEWRWVESTFEDDSFYNGKSVNPIESAKKTNNLLLEW